MTDHPRSRGVYCGGVRPIDRQAGSSPLARGLRDSRRRFRGRPGIIPARAGFTSWADYVLTWEGGSSPLARGLPRPTQNETQNTRIIPARAGFTPRSRSAPARAKDHPRSRGVYCSAPGPSTTPSGSSPLARGLLPAGVQGPCGRRIIPARAGFTRDAHRGAHAGADHPRSRGVYRRDLRPRAPGGGSSPLARGLPSCALWLLRRRGIIPARAGFTPPGP